MRKSTQWILVAAAFVLGGAGSSLLPRAFGQSNRVHQNPQVIVSRYQLTVDDRSSPHPLEWMLDTQTGQLWVKPVDYNLNPRVRQGWTMEPPLPTH